MKNSKPQIVQPIASMIEQLRKQRLERRGCPGFLFGMRHHACDQAHKQGPSRCMHASHGISMTAEKLIKRPEKKVAG